MGEPTGENGFWTSSQLRIINDINLRYWTVAPHASHLPQNTILGTDSNDTLIGTSRDEYLVGGDGDDVLHGGAGNDVLVGGKGNDIYVFGRGDGDDIVFAEEVRENKRDIIYLQKLNRQEVEFINNGNRDLIIRIRDTGETITIFMGAYEGRANNSYGIQAIKFGDGTILERGDLIYDTFISSSLEMLNIVGNDRNNTLIGSGGSNTLDGGGGDDYLDGVSGSNKLIGGTGNDTFVFNPSYYSYEHDTVDAYDPTPGKRDIIYVKGLSLHQVEFLNTEDGHFIIKQIDTGHTMIVLNGMRGAAYGIQAIVFEDGTVVEWEDIVFPEQWGTDGDDHIVGSPGSDMLYGGAGNDTLLGHNGDDFLYGEDGDDYLDGSDGNDILEGGKGDDHLRGGLGNDVYVYKLGDGNDTIDTFDPTIGKRDVIRFTDILRHQVEFTRDREGNLLISMLESGHVITVIDGAQGGAHGIQAVEFGDGVILEWSDIILRDTYGTEEADEIFGSDGDDRIYGLGGDDKIYGGAGNDILSGGEGNDYLEGGTGDDTYIFGKGYGFDIINAYDQTEGKRDIIRLDGLLPSDVEFRSTVDGHFVITIVETGESLTVLNGMHEGAHCIEAIEFGDGSILEWRDVQIPEKWGTNGDDILEASSTGSILHGLDGNDQLVGGLGNDVLDGGAGDDFLFGGLGDDIFVFGRGYGNDRIDASDPTPGKRDIVQLRDLFFEDVEFICTGNDLLLRIRDTDESLTIIGGAFDPTCGIDAFEFADGTVVERAEMTVLAYNGTSNDDIITGDNGANIIYGLEGDDKLFGEGGDDILIGGAGNDILNGGLGNDVYVFGRGDGHDTVNSFDTTPGKEDSILLVGLYRDDVEFLGRNDRDFIIRIKDTGETITVLNGLGSSIYGIQKIIFEDGTTIPWSEVRVNEICGSHNNDLIEGSEEGEWIYGFEGNDIIRGNGGNGGNDIILGGDGNDILDGGSGNDILDGQAGDDHLIGGNGNDVFVFGRGYGNDTIDAYEAYSQKYDIIRLVGLYRDDVDIFEIENRHFVIRINNTGEAITVLDGLRNNYYGVQAIEFADGTLLKTTTIPQVTHGGNAGDNTLNGGNGNDHLFGAEGNDILNGGAGDDILEGGAGDDVLNGGAGNDIYVFGRGDGHDIVNAYDTGKDKRDIVQLYGLSPDEIELVVDIGSNGYMDLIIKIRDTGETLTIKDAVRNGVSNIANYYSIQAIQFGDGTIWEWVDICRQDWKMAETMSTGFADVLGSKIHGNVGDNIINGGSGNDILSGYEGSDKLYGGAGDDVLIGGKGDDWLEGGVGNDTYVWSKGDGNDTISETGGNTARCNTIRLNDVQPGEVDFSVEPGGNSSYYHLIVTITATGERITVYNGLSPSSTNYVNGYSIQAIEFSDGTVWEWEDILNLPFSLGKGITTFTVKEAMKIIGNDLGNTITGGNGNDVIQGGTGNDTLKGGAGDDLLRGGDGDDKLYGETGDDILIGGKGDDYLAGGVGNDIYIWSKGDGNDTIEETGGSTVRHNVLRFTDVLTGEVEFSVEPGSTTNYYHLVILVKDTGERITIFNGLAPSYTNYANAYSIQAIEFADGTVWEWDEILSQPFYLGNGMTTFTAKEAMTVIGNDLGNTITGSAENDIVYGGTGNDTIKTGAGDDILVGGKGDDWLEGGAGNDIYIWKKGDGDDTISETGANTARRNVIRFSDVMSGEVEFSVEPGSTTNYYHLVILVKDTGERITIFNGLAPTYANYANGYSIQAIEFADGTVWEWEEILSQQFF